MNLKAKLDIQNLGKWLSSFKYLIAYVASIFLFSFVYWKNSCFLGLELNGFSEALYFSVVTITTLGFGDISPSGEFGQLLVAAQAFLGVLILGFFLNSLSHVRTEEIKANEQKIAEERIEKLRKGLELHACMLDHRCLQIG